MKKCINCSAELYDNAVICPKCKTQQPPKDNEVVAQTNNSAEKPFTPDNKSKKPKKEKDKKKIKKAIKISIISFASLLVVYIGLCIGYQFLWSNYINNNLQGWMDTVAQANLSSTEWDSLEKEMDKCNKFKILTPFKIDVLFEKQLLGNNLGPYKKLFSSKHFLRQVQECYYEYLKKSSNPDYSIPTDIEATMEILCKDYIQESVFVTNYHYFSQKYFEYFNKMKPVKENVHAYAYIDEGYLRIVNDNAFSIFTVDADLSFSLLYISSYSGAQTVEDQINIHHKGKVEGGTSEDFSLDFDADDYSPFYSYMYCEEQYSYVNVTNISIDPFDAV